MNPSYRNFLQKAQIFLILTLGTAPVSMLLLAFFAEHLLVYAWVPPALYLLFALFSLKIPSKLRILYGVVGMLLLLLIGVLVPEKTAGTRMVALAIGAFYGILLIISLQIAGWERARELPIQYACYCLALHLLGQFIVTVDTTYEEIWVHVTPWMTGTLFLFAGLVMLSMNRTSIQAATEKRQGSSAAIRGKNLLLTVGLFGVGLLAALIPSMIGAVIVAMWRISEWINKILSPLNPDIEFTYPTETVIPTTEPGETDVLPYEPADPLTVDITYAIIVIVAILILTPIVILAIIRVWKALRKLARAFWIWLQLTLFSASEEGYEDEITDTREEYEVEATSKKRGERIKSAFVNEQKLSAQQRVRHYYRRLALKHGEWKQGNTARENLPTEAAEIYERARYSCHPVSDEDAAAFKKNTKKI